MHRPAGSVAFAGVKQEVARRVCFVQADFAWVSIRRRQGLALEHIIIEVGARASERLASLPDSIAVLCNEILDSAEFDGQSGY